MPDNAHAGNIWIKDQATDREVERIIKIWIRDRPQHAAAFYEMVKREYETLFRSNGMSKDGQFAYRGQIPTDVFIILERMFPGFLKTPRGLIKVHNILMEEFLPKPDKKFHIISRKE
ncbi:MAG: hypothetical protein WC683_07200 [bacterium]